MHLVFIEAINKVESFGEILIVELQCSHSLALYDSFTWSEGLVVLLLKELTTVQLSSNREAQLIVINDLSILSNESLVFAHLLFNYNRPSILRLNQQQPSAEINKLSDKRRFQSVRIQPTSATVLS
jgi:hypothetical protein